MILKRRKPGPMIRRWIMPLEEGQTLRLGQGFDGANQAGNRRRLTVRDRTGDVAGLCFRFWLGIRSALHDSAPRRSEDELAHPDQKSVATDNGHRQDRAQKYHQEYKGASFDTPVRALNASMIS